MRLSTGWLVGIPEAMGAQSTVDTYQSNLHLSMRWRFFSSVDSCSLPLLEKPELPSGKRTWNPDSTWQIHQFGIVNAISSTKLLNSNTDLSKLLFHFQLRSDLTLRSESWNLVKSGYRSYSSLVLILHLYCVAVHHLGTRARTRIGSRDSFTIESGLVEHLQIDTTAQHM